MKDTLSYFAYQKSPFKSVKHSTYFEIYDKLFSPYRNKPITFVEIGVLSGGSLFMWREFFGSKARIIGVDLNPNVNKWKDFGFEIYIGSQSNVDFWQVFIREVGPVDIVLDDGGHMYEQQIVTTEMLLSNIKDDGMIVVEDTHTSYMKGYGPEKYSFVNYTKKAIDRINHRFWALDTTQSEKRIWSIQYFDSIVVFYVNNKATNLLSEPTDNHAIDDSAIDFRHQDNTFAQLAIRLIRQFRFLKVIPGSRFIKNQILLFLFNTKQNTRHLKKYF